MIAKSKLAIVKYKFAAKSRKNFEITYVRDFPLKTIGGATEAKMQNPMWSCGENK